MSAAAWARRRQEVSSASEKLARLPESETGHGTEVPLPYADRAAYKGKHSNREINAAIRRAPVVEVPFAGLHAIQHSVKAARVEQYIRDPSLQSRRGDVHPATGTPTDHPIVIQQDGVRYLHDGHHRVTAEMLRGKTKGRARLVDFDHGAAA